MGGGENCFKKFKSKHFSVYLKFDSFSKISHFSRIDIFSVLFEILKLDNRSSLTNRLILILVENSVILYCVIFYLCQKLIIFYFDEKSITFHFVEKFDQFQCWSKIALISILVKNLSVLIVVL